MSPRIVLVRTSHPGNIGATARAMKTMGLTDLVLVDSRVFPHADATARASGADDVLDRARMVPDVATALADCHLVFGTAAFERRLPWPCLTPRAAAVESLAATQRAANVAWVFGCERTGLTNAELQQCHGRVEIPTSPDFSSLNLAAAVQIMAYEWQLASAAAPAVSTEPLPLATHAALQHADQHLQRTLTRLHFLDPAHPGHIMARLRRLWRRARLETIELNILRGILTAIEKRLE